MLNDLRYALRLLLKSPGFSIIAILTLAFGIGVNTAVFSLVHALLFQAPGYARPAQIVQLFSAGRKKSEKLPRVILTPLRDISEHKHRFRGSAGAQSRHGSFWREAIRVALSPTLSPRIISR